MWERFTEWAKRAVFFAQEEAKRRGDGYVSTEHLLLGLMFEQNCPAVRILGSLGIQAGNVCVEVDRRMMESGGKSDQDLRLTPRAKRAIELADDEARSMGYSFIGTEHLLLGLIREEKGGAARALFRLGADAERTRQAVREYAGIPSAAEHTPEQFVAQEALRRRSCRGLRRARQLQLVGLIVTLTSLPAALLFGNPFASDLWALWMILGFLTGIMLILATIPMSTAAVRQLNSLQDVRMVGSLIEARRQVDPTAAAMATQALIHLLPRLQATDAALLNLESRTALYQTLRYGYVSLPGPGARYLRQYLLEVLRVLERIGDIGALPHVQRFARSRPLPADLQEAAQACAANLQLQAEQWRNGQTLLRPAEKKTSADGLLRAADGSSESGAAQLLRPDTTPPAKS